MSNACTYGRQFPDAEAALAKKPGAKVRVHGDHVHAWYEMSRGSGLQGHRSPPKAPQEPSEPRTAARETGFTFAERLAIRTRAGGGDPDRALCEACGVWLGRREGQVHHRLNRQSGGSRFRNGLSNGLLVCGDPFRLCHGKCTIGTGQVMREMEDAGFVLRAGQDPLTEPILLADPGGGIKVWLDDFAHYVNESGDVLSPAGRTS